MFLGRGLNSRHKNFAVKRLIFNTCIMPFILDNQNVFEYLANLNYCQISDQNTSRIQLIEAKNFNLLIAFADGRHLLVKQEISKSKDQNKGEFWSVWWMEETIYRFTEFGMKMRDFVPKPLHFDSENSILIMNFLVDYLDLFIYYEQQKSFLPNIGAAIGKLLGTLHQETYQQQDYRKFWNSCPRPIDGYRSEKIIQRLSSITPDIFGTMPKNCLQFFRLYQKFPYLNQSILELGKATQPSCLIHNDLKLNNFLIDLNWQDSRSQIIKLIDWERVDWGDPAFDLGRMIGSYLEFWLGGLVISSNLNMKESLQLATTPLESIQPSLFTLVQSYLKEFPQIWVDRPDYLDRVIQFAGLSLIRRIEITIEKDRTFGNQGIIMLQVAKQLVSNPQAARQIIFGTDADRL
jgi:5-methylthioribose kinase